MNNFFVLWKNILSVLILLFLFSCGSKKEVVYYQNINDLQNTNGISNYEIKIQPDDLLSIMVTAEDSEIAAPFNLVTISANSTSSTTSSSSSGTRSVSTYLVDPNGDIDFPVLGRIKVAGLMRTELVNLLQTKIEKYIKKPVVSLRLTNFKVAVQGEVTAPGVYPVNTERITLMEALSMARDLTIYGKRDNILIIREINGVKTFNRVDITQADFINSPFYYLAQNDVVYVEPNKTKINNSKIGSDTSLMMSVASILITLITLTISITK